MSHGTRSDEREHQAGSVRALPVDGGPEAPETPNTRRSVGWLRIALPTAAVGVLAVLLLIDTGTLSLNRRTGGRVETPALSLPDEIEMRWETSEFLNTQVVGLTGERTRPLAVVVVGSGTPMLVDPTSDEMIALDDTGMGSAYRHTVLTETAGDALVVSWDDTRVHAWRNPWGAETPETAGRQSHTGLETIEEPVGAAANGDVALILGRDSSSVTTAWTNDGGEHWQHKAVFGLEDANIDVVTALDQVFFVGGSTCRDAVCSPAVWRSTDGIAWSPASGLDGVPGNVTGITSAGPILYAAGTVDPGVGTSWRSDDGGLTWFEERTRGLRETVHLTVLEIDTASTPREARLLVDDETVTVEEGGVLATPLGEVSVPALGDVAVFTFGEETRTVGEDDEWTLYTETRITDIDGLGDRLVAVGVRARPGAQPEPMVWIRTLGSTDWRWSALAGSTPPDEVIIGSTRIVAAGSADGDTVVWSGTQSLLAAERAAVDAVGDFLQGITTADHSLARNSLAPVQLEADAMVLPGLAGVPVRLWQQSGALDENLLIGTADFVAGLDSWVRASRCDAAAPFADPRTVRVVCDYETTSSFLELLGLERSTGALIAMTYDGQITSLKIDAGREADPWNEFGAFVESYGPLLDGIDFADLSAAWEGNPSGRAATAVLEAAAELNRLVFLPGQSRVSESPLGRLEMTWLTDPFGASAIEITALTWTGDEFLAATIHDTGGETWTNVWSSPDGSRWRQAAPGATDRIEGLLSSPEGLVAWGRDDDDFRIWRQDGAAWLELSDLVPEAERIWIIDQAVGKDGALVLLGTWDPSVQTVRPVGLYVDAKGGTRAVDIPDGDIDRGLTVTTGSAGFLLATQDDAGTHLWETSTGEPWRLLADVSDGTFGWVADLAWHEGRYLALIEGDWEEPCRGVERECWPPRDVWTSDDGVTWRELSMTPAVASTVVDQISTGDLGLVAPVRYGRAFLLLWMSTDGADWMVPRETVPRVDPSQWWFTTATVGDSSFIVDMSQSGPEGLPSVSLIVARLVDD